LDKEQVVLAVLIVVAKAVAEVLAVAMVVMETLVLALAVWVVRTAAVQAKALAA
jgi:hypothetical protein